METYDENISKLLFVSEKLKTLILSIVCFIFPNVYTLTIIILKRTSNSHTYNIIFETFRSNVFCPLLYILYSTIKLYVCFFTCNKKKLKLMIWEIYDF